MNDKDKEFSELVGEALGRASMAWSETPIGIFDSDTCCVLHIDIMNAHNEELKKLQAENAKLRECLEFTTYAAEYLFKPDENLAEGLFPTSYFTLSYEGDLELIEKTKRARQVLKELGDK
jgi:hypothetical protein